MARPMMIIAAMMSVLAMESCYSYQAVSVDRKFIIERSSADDTATAGKARAGSAAFRLTVKKFFVRMNSLSPAAVINNSAVDLSSQGRFVEAEILFREVLLEDGPDPAVYNNLGIICEAAGNRDEAFRMYTAACRLMPKNDVFRQNFLSFADYRQGKY